MSTYGQKGKWKLENFSERKTFKLKVFVKLQIRYTRDHVVERSIYFQTKSFSFTNYNLTTDFVDFVGRVYFNYMVNFSNHQEQLFLILVSNMKVCLMKL